ncbi:MAG: hypothetical protein AB1512_06835 [Thermodesulfobacteriota bacterium]
MTRLMKILLIPVLFLALSGTACAAMTSGADYELVNKGGLVSAKGEQVPVMGILERLAETFGMEVFIFGAPPAAPISIDLRNQPSEVVLRTVLRGMNYAVVHNAASGGHGVRIVPSPSKPLGGRTSEKADAAIRSSKTGGIANPRPSQRSVEARPGLSSRGETPSSNPVSVPDVPVAKPSAGAGGGYSGAMSDSAAQAPQQAGTGPSQTGSPPSGAQAAQVAGETQGAAGSSANTTVPGRVERLQRIIATYERRISDGTSDRQYQAYSSVAGADNTVHDKERVAGFQEVLRKARGQ